MSVRAPWPFNREKVQIKQITFSSKKSFLPRDSNLIFNFWAQFSCPGLFHVLRAGKLLSSFITHENSQRYPYFDVVWLQLCKCTQNTSSLGTTILVSMATFLVLRLNNLLTTSYFSFEDIVWLYLLQDLSMNGHNTNELSMQVGMGFLFSFVGGFARKESESLQEIGLVLFFNCHCLIER